MKAQEIRAVAERPWYAQDFVLDSVPSLSDAYLYCVKLATEHYENFPVGSFWIQRDLRKHMHAIYAFARTADDFADEGYHAGERLEKLALWRKLLFEASQGRATHPIFVALSDTIQKFSIPTAYLDALLCAFEQDVRVSRHRDFSSILSYSEKSANPVGRLVLWLHGYRDEERLRWSDSICTALQFANFWQDVAVDWKKDRVYLPLEDMARFDYSEKDLGSSTCNESFRALMKMLCDRTWELFENGRPLCDHLGRDLRMEIRLVWLGGTQILEMIEKRGYDVFQKRPKLGYKNKAIMLWRALQWKRE